jgi:transporter family protein
MDAYILIALFISFLWGIHPIVHKHLLNKYNAVTIMLVSTIVNFSLVIVLSITKKKDILLDTNKITAKDLFIMIGISGFTIFLTNVMYYYILKDNETSIISALIYSSPIFTLIFSYLYFKERLDIYGISGILAIIIGVILVSQNNQFSKELEYLSNR